MIDLQRKHTNFSKSTKIILLRSFLAIGLASVSTIWAIYMKGFGLSNSLIGVISAFFVFIVMLLRIFQLQIISGFKFSEKSKNNYLKKFIIPPNRGCLVSSDGQTIAATYISYNLVSQKIPSKNIKKEICSITGVSPVVLERNIRKAVKKGEILKTLVRNLNYIYDVKSIILYLPTILAKKRMVLGNCDYGNGFQ